MGTGQDQPLLLTSFFGVVLLNVLHWHIWLMDKLLVLCFVVADMSLFLLKEMTKWAKSF